MVATGLDMLEINEVALILSSSVSEKTSGLILTNFVGHYGMLVRRRWAVLLPKTTTGSRRRRELNPYLTFPRYERQVIIGQAARLESPTYAIQI